MPLPAPHLDDRTFQSLVDDAKRMVQQRCPEWTDHNVSDPGVTLIETFAYMVDQILWRLNRVPDRIYVKFLDLLGLRLAPPSAARVPVTFWLSSVQEQTVTVPAGTQVSTPRGEEEPISFSTPRELSIVPCSLHRVASDTRGRQEDRTEELASNRPVPCFEATPQPENCFYVGLTNAVPSCVVGLRFDCEVAGVGVDPRFPPLIWEAWTGESWTACEVERDETGGLNESGEVVLHVPRNHKAHAGIVKQAAGWLRCKVIDNPARPRYNESPRITALSAYTLGGTTDAVNAELVADEIVGVSDGVSAQRFLLRNRPVVPADEPYTLHVTSDEGWEEWSQVDGFGESGPDDHHFLLEETAGEVVFGPAVRQPEGSLRRFGAAPGKGSQIRINAYRTGGGRRGNVARGALSVLKSSVPFIGTVTNREPATGGTDGEDMENAKMRGPILLHTRQRAVTPEDYENLALAAAKEIARVRCVPAGSDGVEAGGARVLLVPHVEDGEHGSVDFGQLVPPDEVYARVAEALDKRRTIGARLLVRAPGYVGMSVVTSVRAKSRAHPERLEVAALEALYRYFHPIRGGPEGQGWPFGRSVVAGEVYAVLQRLRGVDFVDEVRLYPANPIELTREKRTDRIDLGPNDLVFCWGNQVMVQSS